MSLTDLDD